MSRHHVLMILVSASLSATATAFAQEPERTILLHACDTSQGVQGTWATERSKTARIEVNTDHRWLSEGGGSIHLSARSGLETDIRHYYGAMIPVRKADLANRAILLDLWTSTPEATQCVYVRLFGPEGRKAAGWVNWNRPFARSAQRTLKLDQGLSRAGFTWEAEDCDPQLAGEVVAVEIIMGTRTADADLDVYIDQIRMTEARRMPFTAMTCAKKLCPDTELVREGKPQAVIVAPQAEAFLPLATRVQQKVRELTGAELPILTPEQAGPQRLAQPHSILLGNVCNNRAMLPLYAHLYTQVDDAWPGADGFLAHSVHDPWGTGRNVVVLGASSAEGVSRAVDAFIETLKPGRSLVVPRLVLADLGAKQNQQIDAERRQLTDQALPAEIQTAQRNFARGGHRTTAGRMGYLGLQYARTGNDQLAKLYRDLVGAWYESYLAKPPIYGGPWGMDMDFHLEEILPAWDLIEDSPVLSDDDRLRVTRILFEFITTDVVGKAAGALTSAHVRHNHMTFPALGLYFAGRYFQQGYGNLEAEHWLEIAKACFTLQANSAKPHEDCNGYGWLVPYHTMRYALATGDSTYFDNGNVRRQADYAILTMDNLGYQVPYGDTGSYQCWWTEVPFLRGAAFWHRDGRYAWAVEKKQAVVAHAEIHKYACNVASTEPADLAGVRAVPLDRMYWESFQGPDRIPLEKAVDKVVMRTGFDPQRQYLLLDGLSNGGHRHFDGNSISRITDRGRIWLADNDYIRSLPKFHNSLLVFREGRAAVIPDYCELEAVAEDPQFGLSRTVLRNYNGVDWHRTILWAKEQFFLVADELVAQEPGEYDFHCLWHAVGMPRLSDEGLELTQQGPQFWIKHTENPIVKLTDDVELGANWKGYAYAEPVVRSLRQVQSARLERGARSQFVNLLYATDDSAVQAYRLAAADEGVVIYGQHGAWKVTLPQAAEEPVAIGRLVQRLDKFVPRVSAKAGTTAPPSPRSAPAVGQRLWSFVAEHKQQPVPITAAVAGDLDGDGRDEVVAGTRAGGVECLGPDGQSRWRFSAGGPVTTAALGHLNQGQPPAVLIGGEDCQVVALDASGKLRWSFDMPYYKGAGRVRVLLAADIDGDGRDETIAGGDNWRYYVLRPDGSELWHCESVHCATAGATADLDGDGKRELLCGTSYYWWPCAGPDGTTRWQHSVKGPHATVALTARFTAGNERAALFGAEDGNVYALDARGKQQWTANVGDHVSGALALDLDGDGLDEVLAASKSFNLFALDATGASRWRTNLTDPILCVAATDVNADGGQEILAGCQDGSLYVLDTQGRILGRIEAGGPVAAILPARLQPGKATQLVIRTADGPLSAWKW